MRRFYTRRELHEMGLSRAAIRWRVQKGQLRRIIDAVYADGPAPPTVLDKAVAVVVATGGVASGRVAGELLRLDSVRLRGPDVTIQRPRSSWRSGVRRRTLPPCRIITVDGIPCTDGLQTLVDLAAELSDRVWEQALECALHRRLTTIREVQRAAQGHQRGAARMRRVLAQRPPGARPTESLLETLMVQLAREVPGLPPPQRQFPVHDASGAPFARADLAWPELGLFIELDGQHHTDQPIYDSTRETAIVAAMGWLCGRFTWDEVVRHPRPTSRRLAALVDQARRRPLAL